MCLKIAGGGPEALEEYIQSQSPVAPVSSKLKNPKLAKLAAVAAIPATWVLGAALVPSHRVAVRAVGGLVAAAAGGMVGKEAIEEDVRKAGPAAIAQRLTELGLDDPNVADGIARLQEDYGMDEEDFGIAKTEVYAVYLQGMVGNPITKTAEFKELQKLKGALGLTNQQVGQAHNDAALAFYRDTTRFTSKEELDDEDHPDRMSLDKLLFLTERALKQGKESDNAFLFEMSRVARALSGADERARYDSEETEGWNTVESQLTERRELANFIMANEKANKGLTEVAPDPPMTIDQAMERITLVASPFYVRALDSTRSKLDSGAVSEELLLKARNTLGINDFTKQELHMEAFNREIRSLLGLKEDDDDDDDDEYFGGDAEAAKGGEENTAKWLIEQNKDAEYDQEAEMAKIRENMKANVVDTSGIKFAEGSFDRLSKLQEILNLSDEDASYEIAAQVSGYWLQTASSLLESAIQGSITPVEAWAKMHERQNELLLPTSQMKDYMTSIIMQSMGNPLQKTNEFSKVMNAPAVFEGLNEAILAKGVCEAVCLEAGWEEFKDFEAKCFDPFDPRSACGFINANSRNNMYRLFLARSVKNREDGKGYLSDEAVANLANLRAMLGISEVQGEEEIATFFGPELGGALSRAREEIMKGDVSDELMENMRTMIDDVITNFRLDAAMVDGYKLPLYKTSVDSVRANSPGGIPTKDQNEALAKLRQLLDMPLENTFEVHRDNFGPSYKKGVLEALGTTGIVREEFRQPLEDLRERLGMTEEDSRAVYLEALGERMVPMVEYIASEMERMVLTKEQLAQRRGTDIGEDFFSRGGDPAANLGLGTDGNIMSDIMNLVDFYVENDVVQKEQVGTKTVEKKVPADEEGGEEKTVSVEVPVYESTYPITASGLHCIEQKVAQLCYRQFLVGSFQEQGPTAARYESAKSTFGGILGLSGETMESIGSDIGGMVYDNFVTNALTTKGSLDQQDMMTLANIQGKLGISEDEADKLVTNVQIKILSEEFAALMGNMNSSPENMKAFREKCNSLGFELEGDVGIGKRRLQEMFTREISPGIVGGTITGESGDLLAEIQESLGLTEEEGEAVVAEIIMERGQTLFNQARGTLLRGNQMQTVSVLKKMIRYAAFVDGDLELVASKDEAEKMYNLFCNTDFGDADEESVAKDKRLARIALFGDEES